MLDISARTGSNILMVRSTNLDMRYVAMACSQIEAVELTKMSNELVVMDLEGLKIREDLIMIGLGEISMMSS